MTFRNCRMIVITVVAKCCEWNLMTFSKSRCRLSVSLRRIAATRDTYETNITRWRIENAHARTCLLFLIAVTDRSRAGLAADEARIKRIWARPFDDTSRRITWRWSDESNCFISQVAIYQYHVIAKDLLTITRWTFISSLRNAAWKITNSTNGGCCCIGAGQTLRVHSSDGSTFLCEMTSCSPSWKCDVP